MFFFLMVSSELGTPQVWEPPVYIITEYLACHVQMRNLAVTHKMTDWSLVLGVLPAVYRIYNYRTNSE
jgi:hypothetical protein